MDKELIEQINKILNKKEIDERAKSFIKLYFLGKVKVGEITSEELESKINTLCSRIKSVEFSSNNIVAAYSDKSGVLTINKQLLLDGKSDKVILPVFTKFEGILNQNNRNEYANYIEDFIRAGRIAESTSSPISDELYKLYEMAKYCYGNIEDKTGELIQDSSWEATCSKYNNAIKNLVVTGQANQKELLNGANLFHYEVFTGEALQNPDFEGPFKTEEYQKKAARILEFVEGINPEINPTERASLARNIRLFTGCTREMIEESKTATHMGDSRMNTIFQSESQNYISTISEEVIVANVQSMLDRKPEWDSRIKHLVIPFFIRSQRIYNWNMDEFNERLNQIDLKIDKIGFEDLGNITTMGDTAMDKIRLNSRIFFDRNGKPAWPITKTLFHELGHNTDENDREGISSKQRLQESALDSGRYYEWTNTIFERLASGERFYKKDNAMQLSQSGYDALAPLGSMLACALGVSEIEFAKIKDKGQEYEAQWLEKMFPSDENNPTSHGPEVLKRAKEIFDAYELDTSFSLSKKSKNQSLLNEMYQECLSIMERRIEIDLQSNNIANPEQYKKQQMFLLKKMNFNFKSATRADGLRFSRTPIVHDIGFCIDNLSKKETAEISAEYAAMADFGFDNNTLGKYSTAMVQTTKDRKDFSKALRVQPTKIQKTPQQENDEATLDPIDKEEECK